MNHDDAKAKSIFLSAIEEYQPKQWPEFLDGACGDNAALRAQVEELLESYSHLGSFREKPGADIAATTDQPHLEKLGAQIGPFKLLEVIGVGGMGVVYRAEQREPLERQVALKIIKPGMDTQQVIARFDAERHALARMDHANIAHVLDAGTTDSGRPYFVMELVQGIPITEYCDQYDLSIRERLELFVSVCQAVQHAHQKGIIHRDLKPSNEVAS
jgi:serine/threonine protein kinase